MFYTYMINNNTDRCQMLSFQGPKVAHALSQSCLRRTPLGFCLRVIVNEKNPKTLKDDFQCSICILLIYGFRCLVLGLANCIYFYLIIVLGSLEFQGFTDINIGSNSTKSNDKNAKTRPKKRLTGKICNYIMHKMLCLDLWLQRLSFLAAGLSPETVLESNEHTIVYT